MSAAASQRTPPVWWLMFKREMSELWLGGRGFNLLILFCLLMSLTTWLLATNSELNLTPREEIQFIALQAIMTFGLFLGLVIAAESIAGERERTTLEALLLTPGSRRQIVVGKYLTALSLWPAALLLAIPYMFALERDTGLVWRALAWGAPLGTLLALTFTGIGMIVSLWSNTGRTSLFISLLFYLASLLPAQLPGEFMATPIGLLVQAAGPLEAAKQFLQHTLVSGEPVADNVMFVIIPALVALVVLAVLFLYAAPRLQFNGVRGLRRAGTPAREGGQ